MRIETWLDRITDESNLWLNAIKMDDAGKFFEAFVYYLKDASECLKHKSLIRAALSCSCAANCLTKLGDFIMARKLYQEAALIYDENASVILGTSIRESLWSLEESYECFLLAGDEKRSKEIYRKYISLLTKINPFAGEETRNVMESRKMMSLTKSNINKNNLALSSEVNNILEEFLQLRSNFQTKSLEKSYILQTESGHEESIAS